MTAAAAVVVVAVCVAVHTLFGLYWLSVAMPSVVPGPAARFLAVRAESAGSVGAAVVPL